MEALQYRPREDGHNRTVANFSNQVVVALDHLTNTAREGVYTTVEAFARHEEDGDRLPLPEPLYVLRAAPEVLVIVRWEPGAPVEVEDIVRPAALRNFAHADAQVAHRRVDSRHGRSTLRCAGPTSTPLRIC